MFMLEVSFVERAASSHTIHVVPALVPEVVPRTADQDAEKACFLNIATHTTDEDKLTSVRSSSLHHAITLQPSRRLCW